MSVNIILNRECVPVELGEFHLLISLSGKELEVPLRYFEVSYLQFQSLEQLRCFLLNNLRFSKHPIIYCIGDAKDRALYSLDDPKGLIEDTTSFLEQIIDSKGAWTDVEECTLLRWFSGCYNRTHVCGYDIVGHMKQAKFETFPGYYRCMSYFQARRNASKTFSFDEFTEDEIEWNAVQSFECNILKTDCHVRARRNIRNLPNPWDLEKVAAKALDINWKQDFKLKQRRQWGSVPRGCARPDRGDWSLLDNTELCILAHELSIPFIGNVDID